MKKEKRKLTVGEVVKLATNGMSNAYLRVRSGTDRSSRSIVSSTNTPASAFYYVKGMGGAVIFKNKLSKFIAYEISCAPLTRWSFAQEISVSQALKRIREMNGTIYERTPVPKPIVSGEMNWWWKTYNGGWSFSGRTKVKVFNEEVRVYLFNGWKGTPISKDNFESFLYSYERPGAARTFEMPAEMMSRMKSKYFLEAL